MHIIALESRALYLLASSSSIFWPSILSSYILWTLWSCSPRTAPSTLSYSPPGRPGSNLDLSALSSPFICLHSAPFTHPPKSWFHSFYLSNLALFSLCFVSRVIPSSPSTCQSWQKRSTRLTSTRDKIWRALCGSTLNTLTPFSLAASPRRWVERKAAGPRLC